MFLIVLCVAEEAGGATASSAGEVVEGIVAWALASVHFLLP